jgi:hypothetical protein
MPAGLLAATVLAACGQATSTDGTSATGAPLSAAASATGAPLNAAATATHTTKGRSSHAARRKRRHSRKPVAHPAPSPGGRLAYATASGQMVQPQPPAGSCHALGSGDYSRPDPRCTPGALNPAVRQATIDQTICVSGWTSTVRPPESVTEAEKRASLAAYGDSGPLSDYEYDHFVPLELGGAVNDPRNLWPEPGASPNPKDEVESALREQVCAGRMTLAQAQLAIARNWVKLATGGSGGSSTGAGSSTGTGSSTGAGSPSTPGSQCSASAVYSNRYGDWDVYVHSNQPDATVSVSDAAGRTDSWHTDSSGYADVYFKAPASAAGEAITVRAGPATCHATL